MRLRGAYAFLFAAALSALSCSVTRYVPRDEYLLNRNVIKVDRQTPRKERISAEEFDRFVRQTPARKLLRTNIPVAIWSASDTSRNNFGNRLLRSLGSRPVVLDSAQLLRSAGNIESYMRSRGYYQSELDWRVETRGRKAKVIYEVTQGEPYRIGDITYRFRDEFLRPAVLSNSGSRLINPGDVFDIGQLNAERSRIADQLKNSGYFNFTVNNIEYLADSTRGDRTVDLTLVVRQNIEGYNERGEPQYENNPIYRISEIILNPEYNPSQAATDPTYYSRFDTVSYNGLEILHTGRPKVRSKVLRQAVKLHPNYFYDASAVQEAYSDIMRLGYFRSAGILFEDVTDTTQTSTVTFIGESDEADNTGTTREGYLKCTINCIPALRQSYKIDLEGSVSSNFFAVGATVGYQNRNMFRGAELFDISLTGRYEFLRSTGNTGSYEIGGNISLTWPRFLSLFPVDRYGKRANPRTRFEMSLNYQNRPIYQRTLSGVRLSYSWNDRDASSFILRPVDINLINVNNIDPDFLAGLKNPYLQQSYESQLVPGLSFSYTYNSQLRKVDAAANSSVFRLNFETMGNLFSVVSRLVSHPHTDGDKKYYNAFGMRFSQYVRAEASLSRRIVIGDKTSVVWRVLAGGGMSYGNHTPIPIDRLFYSGGSNSMRGWIVRRLGPGTVPNADKTYPSQVGNLKLEANLEFRFPVWDFVHSAVFLDAGNIWFAGKGNYDEAELNEAAQFRFNRFARQLGLNTGLGVRLDFSRFIFRVDWGIKLHDPGQPAGKRWIHNFRLSNTALNFGVGYPF